MFYIFEGYSLDTDRRELRRGDEIVALQPQVFDLLEYLVANRDRVVSKDDMLEAIWGGRFVSASTLSTRVNAARTAVGDNGDQQRLIRTLPRKGIRFVAAVREGARPADEPAAPPAVIDGEMPEPTPAHCNRVAPAERRQLTIASCELLLGAVAGGMDPEDLREVIQGYRNCVAETIRRQNGLVANTHGNTAVVYFGYPQAHEDDPERAVRAAIELIAAVATLRIPVQTRVGIATGLVVIGNLGTSGEAQERGIVGATPSLAAGLQGIAEPNAVIIADGTRKLLGNLFELEDLGAKEIKEIAAPVRAWSALRPSSAAGRFEAFHATGLTDLVGRAEEFELLLRRWSRAKSGAGQVVLLSGEAGIGKSRLTAALLERLASEPHTRLRKFCSPQHTGSAFYPTIGMIERSAGFTRGDTLQTKLDKLDTLLARSSTSAHDAALFAEMLSLQNDGRYPTLELTSQQRRQRTLEALVSQVTTLSRQRPVLMILEDMQWADPTSLELFSRIVDKIPTLRVLLLVTFRPEFDSPWIGRPYVTALTVNRLAEGEISAMIDGIVSKKVLPANFRQDIIERSDGIPLFVEEMTKAVLEAESEDAARRTAAAIPSPTFAVPVSLQASLMARLDRLGAAKEVAQIGAAIGRKFSYALLSSVVNKSEPELASALDRLAAAGLLFQQGVSPHSRYLFKHALVQDAAYGTLLREPKRALHARIVETLESRFAEIAEGQPELLARHCTEAGLIERAARLWGKAGQRSLARSALVEAAEQLTRALDQIAGLPSTPAQRREQIKLQVAVITPLIHVKGYAALETRTAVERARQLMEKAEALGEHPEDPLLLFSVLYGFWIVNTVAFRGEVTRESAAQFLALAEKQGAKDALMIGHRLMGISLSQTGNIAEGRTHLDQSVALYDPAAHRALATKFGQDTRVVVLTNRACDLWALGYPEAGLADADHALQDAREIGHATTLMYALSFTPIACFLCEEYAEASGQVDESVALADQKDASYWKALGMLNKALLSAMTAKTGDAAQKMACCITAYRSTGATFLIPTYLSFLARAYAEVSLSDDAWGCIEEAMTLIETTKEKFMEAEANRISGEIALKSPNHDTRKAEAYFERALAVARQQQAKSWELRAAMSMARLWRDQGKRDEARELLAPVYGWFTEGFDTLDLKTAKALLDELRV